MAAQWEAHAQQQAMQRDTDGGAVEEATAADDSPAVATDAVQAEASPRNAVDSNDETGQGTASHTDANDTSVAVEADGGSAVDGNADEAMPDVVGDAKASQTVAGVTSATDVAPTVDAVEARRQEKQKAAAEA